jgi:hypothetical protein
MQNKAKGKTSPIQSQSKLMPAIFSLLLGASLPGTSLGTRVKAKAVEAAPPDDTTDPAGTHCT